MTLVYDLYPRWSPSLFHSTASSDVPSSCRVTSDYSRAFAMHASITSGTYTSTVLWNIFGSVGRLKLQESTLQECTTAQ